MPSLPSCAWTADSNVENEVVEPKGDETGEAEKGAENELKTAVENQLALLKNEPDNPEALRRLASLYIRDGDSRNADKIFTRLLALNLNDPAAVLPYAMGKWHLRQEYEAQAAMLRGLGTEGLFPGSVKLLQTTLDDIYDAKSMTSALKPEFPKPEELQALQNLESYFEEALERIRVLEANRDASGLASYTADLFGDDPEIRAYFALWRCFSHVHANDLDGAEAMLTLAASAIDDARMRADAATASALLREIRRGPLSSGILNSLSEILSDVSSTVGGQLSDSYVGVNERFDQARQLTRDRKFPEAAAVLDSIRPLLSDNSRRARYIYYHADVLWGREEYARANQAYVVSSVLQKERYALSSILYRMAEYSVMLHKIDDAANYAIRSAGYLRDQAWKLRQVGSFLMELDMTERGIAYLERSLDASDSLAGDAESYAALASAYKRIGERDTYLDYAESYVETIDRIIENRNDVNDTQYGLRYYFEGELLASKGMHQEAYQAYERASGYVTERFRLSEILMAMADYQANGGKYEEAEKLAVRAGDLIPEQAWKARQVGNLLLRIGKRTEGIKYLESALEHSFSVQDRTLSFSALADAYRNLGDMDRAFRYAREYIALVEMHRDSLTDQEEALAAFYQGEIHTHSGERDLAYSKYEHAASLLENRFRRAETFMRMADYQMTNGAREEGAALAEKSAEEIPDQGWKLQQVGNFFLRHGMSEKAMEYFRRFVQMTSPGENLGVYAIMADAYKAMNKPEQYIQSAMEYNAAAVENGRVPSDREKGLIAYYEGEIHRLRGEKDQAYEAYQRAAELVAEPERLAEVLMEMARYQAEIAEDAGDLDAAYAAFEQASGLVTERFRLSEIFWRMAQIEAKRGDREKAAELARRSAGILPNETWKRKQTGDFLISLDMPDRALEYIERQAGQAADAGADGKPLSYAALAEARKRAGDTKQYLYFANEFVNAFEADAGPHSPAEEGLAAYYLGELRMSRNEEESAYESYEKAGRLIEDKGRLVDIFMKMAEIRAGQGDSDAAAALAEKAADASPDPRVLQRVGDFLMRLDKPEQALAYYLRNAQLPTSQAAALNAYYKIAEASRKIPDLDKYRQYAGEYAALVEKGGDFTRDQMSLAAYYRAEVKSLDDDPDEAYRLYEKALELAGDDYRRAESIVKMADIEATRGDAESAAGLAERLLALYPDDAWRVGQAAGIFSRVDNPGRAIQLFERRLGLVEKPKDKAGIYSQLADAYRKMNDEDNFLRYAGEYVAVVSSGAFEPSVNEIALGYYYRGERNRIAKNLDEALADFEEAARLRGDNKYRYAEVLMKIADIEATRGNNARAAEFAERSLAVLPDEAWKVRQTAELYLRIDMSRKALETYDRYLSRLTAPKERAEVYRLIAETHRSLGDDEKFAEGAGRYLALLWPEYNSLTSDEKGAFHYYQGERERIGKRPAEAFAAYRQAAEFIKDNSRLAETFMKMADIEADRGNVESAVDLAERSAGLLPDDDAKLRGVAAFLLRLGLPNRGAALFERKLSNASTPAEKAKACVELANFHKSADDTDAFVRVAGKYTALVFSDASAFGRDDLAQGHIFLGDIHYARKDRKSALKAYEDGAQMFEDGKRAADALMTMARIEFEMEDKAAADALLARAVSRAPDDGRRIMDAASLYMQNGMPEKAMRLFERRLSMAVKPADRASVLSAIADANRRQKNQDDYIRYARRYVKLVSSPGFVRSRDTEALRHFFLGGVSLSEDRYQDAVNEFELALGMFSDKYRKYETLLLLAEVSAKWGKIDQAVRYAERAADAVHDQAWQQRVVGQFFANLEMMEKALFYYRRYLEMAKNDKDRATAYSTLTWAYKQMGENDRYIRYARLYVDVIAKLGDEASRNEKGTAAYFRGEILTEEKRPHDAYLAYEIATGYLDEPYRLAEIYAKLARYNVTEKNFDQAASLALVAADLADNEYWRIREVANILIDAKCYNDAVAVTESAIAAKPEANGELYQLLSTALIRGKQRSRGIKAHAQYAEHLIRELERIGPEATREQRLKLLRVRQSYADLTTPIPFFGLDSDFYTLDYTNNRDFYRGMRHELYHYYYLNRYLRGKIYVTLSGTVNASYHGTYLDAWGNEREWNSRPGWGDTSRVAFGISVNPFPHQLFTALSFKAEYIIGTGRNAEDDFRFRITYDRFSDTRPQPVDRIWHYWKIYSDTRYSTRDNDVTSDGNLRRGLSVVSPWDRNFIVNPYAAAWYDYRGKTVDSSVRWAADVGFGIALKKYIGETRHRAPRESIELDLYYKWGLTKERWDGFGVIISTKF